MQTSKPNTFRPPSSSVTRNGTSVTNPTKDAGPIVCDSHSKDGTLLCRKLRHLPGVGSICLPSRLPRSVVDFQTKWEAQSGLVSYVSGLKELLEPDAIRKIWRSVIPYLQNQRITGLQVPSSGKSTTAITLCKSGLYRPSESPEKMRDSLPCRVVLVPRPTACTDPCQAEHSYYPLPHQLLKAFCPFLPDYLPPLNKDEVSVVYVDVPSASGFRKTLKIIITGEPFGLIELPKIGGVTWQDSYSDPERLARVIYDTLKTVYPKDTEVWRLFRVIFRIDQVLRVSLNCCKLGVWDNAILDRLDMIYAGYLHTFTLFGQSFTMKDICSWEELEVLLNSPRSLGEMYVEALGAGTH